MTGDLLITGAPSAKEAPRIGVMLLHGLTGMPSEMRPLARHLEKLGCRVVVPILAGHGGGHKELLAASWKDWVRGAREALASLAQEVDRVFVGGLSMGSSIASVLAAEEPRVDGIIYLSTTLRYDGSAIPGTYVLLPLVDLFPFLGEWCYWTEDPPYGLRDERLQRIITRSIEKAKNGETSDFGLFRTYAGSLRQMCHLVRVVRRTAGKVTCPALILHSLEDSMTSARNAAEIYSRLGSADKTIVGLTGCDHVLTLDLQKERVAELVGDFVLRVTQNQERVGGKWQAA